MLVTEVEIVFVKPHGGLVAFASVVVDDQLYLGGIAIHQRLDGYGYRITYPTRKLGDSQNHIFHPIRKPLSAAIEQAITQKMKDVMRKSDAGHHSTNIKSNGI